MIKYICRTIGTPDEADKSFISDESAANYLNSQTKKNYRNSLDEKLSFASKESLSLLKQML